MSEQGSFDDIFPRMSRFKVKGALLASSLLPIFLNMMESKVEKMKITQETLVYLHSDNTTDKREDVSMPSIRPRIDPSEYARQKAEKAEKARLRREEIKRKQRGESIDEDAVPTRDFQEGKEDNSGADIGNNVQQNRRQHHQDHAHKHGEQNQNTTSSAHVVASFLNPPKNPEGCEFSPSYFEKNRQQFGNDEEFDRPSSCLAIHHNGIEGCVGSSDHALYTFQLSTGSGLRRLYSRHGGHTDWVSSVTYLPDGRVLSGGMDGKLCLWSRGGGAAASAEDLIGEQGSISKVTNVPLSPNCAASSGYDGSICLWDLSKHTAKLRKIQNERKALPPILNVAFSHDGKKLLSGTNNGLISLWDMGSEKVIKAAAGKHKSQVPYVVSHPSDDCLFFTASVDGTVALFDTRGPLGSVNNNEVGSTLCTKVFQVSFCDVGCCCCW